MHGRTQLGGQDRPRGNRCCAATDPLDYDLERRGVATRLLEIDAELIQLHADTGKSSDPNDIQRLVDFVRKHLAFQAGTDITYPANSMVDGTCVPHVRSAMAELINTKGLIVGRRLLPATVRRFIDGLVYKVLEAAPCDGRFTIFVCCGDITVPGKVDQLKAFRDVVYRSDGIWARLENLRGAASVLRMVAITTTSHLSVEAATIVHKCLGLPALSALVPTPEEPALFDTSSLYSDDIPCLSPYVDHTTAAENTTAATDILSAQAAVGILLHPLHQKWDIDLESGGVVVVRPDGHVGTMSHGFNGDSWKVVEKYFEEFLVL
ncbi:thioredoxin-like protein [Mycena metata]|nr:thioredoxin-like protein [Mycena metata]KAJ7726251.1 thioredoxin-like protein [Mycena metata]